MGSREHVLDGQLAGGGSAAFHRSAREGDQRARVAVGAVNAAGVSDKARDGLAGFQCRDNVSADGAFGAGAVGEEAGVIGGAGHLGSPLGGGPSPLHVVTMQDRCMQSTHQMCDLAHGEHARPAVARPVETR